MDVYWFTVHGSEWTGFREDQRETVDEMVFELTNVLLFRALWE